MNYSNSRVYRFLEVLADFFMLNLLWLALCIPLVTAFPATAAMFGVVREWVKDRDSGFLGPFVRHLKDNFAQSLLIGFLWTMLTILLSADFSVINLMDSSIRLPMFVVLAWATLAYLFTSIYLFPVMVNYKMSWWAVIKNSFLIAVGHLPTTILCLLVVGLAALMCFYLPMAVLFAGSVTAYLVYSLCHRSFRRLEGGLRTTDDGRQMRNDK